MGGLDVNIDQFFDYGLFVGLAVFFIFWLTKRDERKDALIERMADKHDETIRKINEKHDVTISQLTSAFTEELRQHREAINEFRIEMVQRSQAGKP